MTRPLAQLVQDVADAERLATLHVTQTVCRRLLEEVLVALERSGLTLAEDRSGAVGLAALRVKA